MTGSRALILVAGAVALFGLSGCATSVSRETQTRSAPTLVTDAIPSPSPSLTASVSPSAMPPVTARTPPPKVLQTSFPPDPPANWLMGLQSHNQVDGLEGHFLDYTNAFGGNDGDAYYFVVAGADLESASEGWVSVTRRNTIVDDGHATSFGIAAPGHGRLTIVRVALPLITLRAADGTPFTLNLRAHTLKAAR
jgi:hypothetical protein